LLTSSTATRFIAATMLRRAHRCRRQSDDRSKFADERRPSRPEPEFVTP
jgi:hypothetical protein